ASPSSPAAAPGFLFAGRGGGQFRFRRACSTVCSSSIGKATTREAAMDMSVNVGAAGDDAGLDRADGKPVVRGANSSDLDLWLEKAGARGERKRITAEVDPDLEAATITYLVGGQKSPALLFENIKGHPGHKALYNMIGCNLSRFCLMIGERPVEHPLEAVQILQKKLGHKMPPREVPAEQAICNQNVVEGDKIDIRMFPAQR